MSDKRSSDILIDRGVGAERVGGDSERRGLPLWLLDLQELRLRDFCRKCVALLPCRLGYADVSLYLHDVEQGVLTLAETNHARPIDLAVKTADDHEHLMTRVARSGEFLETHDVRGERDWPSLRRGEERPYADGACLVAPLRGGGRLWGVLNFSRRRCGPETEADPPLEPIFAFLGKALHHACSYDRVQTEARVDGLTRLYNYRWLTETLAKEIRRAQRFQEAVSLILLDLDGLKAINDQSGHAAGDLLLRHVAARVSVALRHCDSAARVGGDEFVVMLPATDVAGAREVARRILNTIREDAALFRGAPLPITASLGVAQWQPGWSAEDLINAADRMMYRAKRQGRNQIACRPPAQVVIGAPLAEAPPLPSQALRQGD